MLTRARSVRGTYRRWTVLICALVLPGIAGAAQSMQAANIEGYCTNAEQDFHAIVANLDYIDEALPQIPPEENRYFRKEYAAIMGR